MEKFSSFIYSLSLFFLGQILFFLFISCVEKLPINVGSLVHCPCHLGPSLGPVQVNEGSYGPDPNKSVTYAAIRCEGMTQAVVNNKWGRWTVENISFCGENFLCFKVRLAFLQRTAPYLSILFTSMFFFILSWILIIYKTTQSLVTYIAYLNSISILYPLCLIIFPFVRVFLQLRVSSCLSEVSAG